MYYIGIDLGTSAVAAAGMITLPTEKELEKLMDEIRQNHQQYRITA